MHLLLAYLFLRVFTQATTLIAIMSPRCSVCADLKVDESGEWPFSVGGDSEEAPTLQDIRSSSRKCQTGGCGMLLKSIAKFCPDASDTLQLCLRTNDSFTGAVFGWLRLEHTTMELYITQGRVSHQR
jgi:hypothetical protein